MKTILIAAFNLLALTSAQAQDKVQKENLVFRMVEEPPAAGFDIIQYLSKNLQYPAEALKNQVEGKIYMSFVVNEDGSLSNIEILRGKDLGNGLPEEAIRLIKSMPKWKPGKQNGVNVRVYYSLPVTFRLN
ncbi:hypothetical protein DBR32_10175 [Taibaiella sp. KBW10]|uniref:energy transducer TonB n=1 Tax=Taibaiella sp. KBW10 TaxID=2153357 RepID=UPI000F5B867F|nr:energy transducer TonB [Taibaiella sp. KBW10]RQO31062.1 hypothetical protein DBR32_10175 [Taibaiella sp. KBW10]